MRRNDRYDTKDQPCNTSEQERKRIQRYCICPKVAGAALAMAFVLPLLIIPSK